MVFCSCRNFTIGTVSQSANKHVQSIHQKKKISQKSKELHIINQMKISKEVKQELIRSTKNKKNGLNRVMNRKKLFKKK